ncbi:regulator of cell autolysis [Chryseobacterium sp. G0240]|uniref:histidine kinase n=1 Tax=Chryseobacterium sp. G0240 TaxID=2487066 RepID=UPI000F44CA7C|nr:histidine kinase [Chryseobacterium sp. G0240]ROI03276.1 regulator of cell autolysis [Chryseobacterium sp. G0240]
MPRYLTYFGLVMALLTLMYCNKSQKTENHESPLTERIEKLKEIRLSPKNKDSLLNAWRSLDHNKEIQQDTLLATRVNYNLARLQAMVGKDSAEYYIEKALTLIESTKDNLPDKALVYNGMGNILMAKGKEHQAAFYYNKAAAVIRSDAGLKLSAEAKTSILLSAAQSNRYLYDYGLAKEMNLAALKLVDSLPEVHINRQRALVQIIHILALQKMPGDSIKVYLKKLETLHKKHPDDYDKKYYYNSKNNFFEKSGENDSLLHYQKLMKIEEEKAYEREKSPAIINNLFIAHANIGAIFIEMKKGDSAGIALAEAKKMLSAHKDQIDTSNIILYKTDLAKLYELKGDYKKAVKELYGVKSLQQEYFQNKNTRAIAEMNALYQLQAKDKSIRMLNEDIQINQLELEQNRLWLIVVVLILVLLLGLICFLYYYYQQRRKSQERDRLLLQQQLLRTQMEPHFIFNTLAAVQSFVRLDQKDAAIQYLNRFSRLLRSSLELSRQQYVPLDEEIETLDNYLRLQQMRYDQGFSYELQYPEEQDLGAIMVPPMLVQPYVENAIVHGINIDSDKALISVVFQLQKDILTIRIADTGKLEKMTRTSHRSLSGAISNERILLLGKKASVETSLSESGGRCVTLHIPVVFG